MEKRGVQVLSLEVFFHSEVKEKTDNEQKSDE